MNNLANLGNLRFFTEKGYEIKMQKLYTITWEIIPDDIVKKNFIVNPSGHFLLDNDENISVVVDNPGMIYSGTSYKIAFTDLLDNTVEISSLGLASTETSYKTSDEKETIMNNNSVLYFKYYYRLKRNRLNEKIGTDPYEEIQYGNKVRISITTNIETITNDYDIEYIFAPHNINIGELTTNAITTGGNTETLYKLNSKVLTLTTTTCERKDSANYNKTVEVIKEIIDITIGLHSTLYPYVQYQGVIQQDKVSTNFIATNTIIVYEEEDGVLKHPTITVSDYSNIGESSKISNVEYSLLFEFQKDSEMKFISSTSEADIIWNESYNEKISETKDSVLTLHRVNNPLYFSVGFQTSEEGAYQNALGIFIVCQNDSNTIYKKYFLGVINFLTEVEGEDERFRALLGNFGIPDPITYPNVFKSQDALEECVDWTVVNKKSKELMIYYDQIFPYVGTYKALLNALKFLGYQDIVFKEWYRIKDQNDKDRYSLIQTYDFETGEPLASKLKRANVTYGEFERYRKLNRLTMIYHLNEIDYESGEYLDIDVDAEGYFNGKTVRGVTTSVENGLYKASNEKTWTRMSNQLIDIPTTYKLYEYRTDEVLAKLYSVKQWLEKYILGVNCYISDVCGEGIVIERLKNQAYVTEHHLQDFYTEGSFTPKITSNTTFTDSSALLTCTLNEYDSACIEDYKDLYISNFITNTIVLPSSEGTDIDTNIYISNPFETLVVGNEVQYEVHLDNVSTGTLAEYTTVDSSDNPIYVEDGEIYLWNDEKASSVLDSSELPIITIAKGNIRYTHGQWKDAIKYAIVPEENASTGEVLYYLISPENNTRQAYKLKLHLYPKKDANNKILGKLLYTLNNSWNIPMFVMSNYKINNDTTLLDPDTDYILEIIEGQMDFRNKLSEVTNNLCDGTTLRFSETDELGYNIPGELDITLSYTYMSDRLPLYSFGNISNISIGTIATTTYPITNVNEYISGYDLNEDKLYSRVLVDYRNYKTNECTTDFNDYKAKYQLRKTNEAAYNALITKLYKNYKSNRNVNIPVNRLGEYTVTVKGYDGYNNIYVNKSDDTYTLTSKYIDINTVVNQQNSSNAIDFYGYNKDGKLLNSANIASLIAYSKQYPEYPTVYKIDSFDYDEDTKELVYDNISYALDTPKVNDYLLLNNLTERVYDITIDMDNKSAIIYLDNENPNRQYLSRIGGFIGLCLYNNIEKRIIETILPCKVTSANIADPTQSTAFTYTSTINISLDPHGTNNNVLEGTTLGTNTYNFVTNNDILLYAFNAIELVYNATSIKNSITLDYENNTTIIKDTSCSFNTGDIIKACLTLDGDMHDKYDINDIDNEVAYKIKDVSIKSSTEVYYTLDGIIDFQKLDNNIYHNNNNVKITKVSDTLNIYKVVVNNTIELKICPLHLSGVQYVLRVNSDADEQSVLYSKYNYYIMQTSFLYNDKQLKFSKYMSDEYAGYVQDYDADNLANIWFNASKMLKTSDSLYKFTNYPITIEQNRNIIIYPDTTQNILDNTQGLNYEWAVKTYTYDDVNNWDIPENYIGKETLFRSVTPFLTIAPYILGPYQLQLNVIDIYGNRITNEGEGLLYVKEGDHTLRKRISFDEDSDDTGSSASIAEIQILNIDTNKVPQAGGDVKYANYLNIKYKLTYSNGKSVVAYNTDNNSNITITYKDNTTAESDFIQVSKNDDVNEYTLQNLDDPENAKDLEITVNIAVNDTELSASAEGIKLVQYGIAKPKDIIISLNIPYQSAKASYFKMTSTAPSSYTVTILYTDDSTTTLSVQYGKNTTILEYHLYNISKEEQTTSLHILDNYTCADKEVGTTDVSITVADAYAWNSDNNKYEKLPYGLTKTTTVPIYLNAGDITNVKLKALKITNNTITSEGMTYLPEIKFINGDDLNTSYIGYVNYKDGYKNIDCSIYYSFNPTFDTSVQDPSELSTYVDTNLEEYEKNVSIYVKAVSKYPNSEGIYPASDVSTLVAVQSYHEPKYTYLIYWTGDEAVYADVDRTTLNSDNWRPFLFADADNSFSNSFTTEFDSTVVNTTASNATNTIYVAIKGTIEIYKDSELYDTSIVYYGLTFTHPKLQNSIDIIGDNIIELYNESGFTTNNYFNIDNTNLNDISKYTKSTNGDEYYTTIKVKIKLPNSGYGSVGIKYEDFNFKNFTAKKLLNGELIDTDIYKGDFTEGVESTIEYIKVICDIYATKVTTGSINSAKLYYKINSKENYWNSGFTPTDETNNVLLIYQMNTVYTTEERQENVKITSQSTINEILMSASLSIKTAHDNYIRIKDNFAYDKDLKACSATYRWIVKNICPDEENDTIGIEYLNTTEAITLLDDPVPVVEVDYDAYTKNEYFSIPVTYTRSVKYYPLNYTTDEEIRKSTTKTIVEKIKLMNNDVEISDQLLLYLKCEPITETKVIHNEYVLKNIFKSDNIIIPDEYKDKFEYVRAIETSSYYTLIINTLQDNNTHSDISTTITINGEIGAKLTQQITEKANNDLTVSIEIVDEYNTKQESKEISNGISYGVNAVITYNDGTVKETNNLTLDLDKFNITNRKGEAGEYNFICSINSGKLYIEPNLAEGTYKCQSGDTITIQYVTDYTYGENTYLNQASLSITLTYIATI